MAARLVITGTAYVLQDDARDGAWTEIATLAGGAGGLLREGQPVDEMRLEGAIERAEDWLMPHAARLAGQVLEIQDATGRLRPGLGAVLSETSHAWSVEAFEALFLRLVDLATGRHPPAALQGRQPFVADVLLLRELAHHGKLAQLRLA
jgi:hypothetical protein